MFLTQVAYCNLIPKLPHLNELASVLQENIPGFKTLVLNINKDKTNVILGKENKVIYGNGKI